MENIETMKREIHENAVAHGWWESDRSFGEICALIHSELSEALEEYRSGNPNIYVITPQGITPITPEDWNGEKPEGIAVELDDAVIRILDYMGKEGIEYCTEADDVFEDYPLALINGDFGDFIARCHSDISDAYIRADVEDEYGDLFSKAAALSVCIRRIETWFEAKGLDLAEIIAVKHQYNKSRSYRHGGKRI